MISSIPYQRPPKGPLREISDRLENGCLSGQNADRLLAAGINWELVAPHVQELSWWESQKPKESNPPKQKWSVRAWGSTLRLMVNGIIIWVDPGTDVPIPDQEPELVIITHAHFDHIAQLSKWYQNYPSLRIVMTKKTAELMWFRVYDEFELRECLRQIIQVDFFEERIISDVHIKFLPAGHLFGAAMVEVGYSQEKILVTGDFALREVGGLPGATLPSDSYDIVVMGATESSPGFPPMADLRTNHLSFLKSISDRLDQGQSTILIPTQAFGQAQEAYTAIVMAQRAGAFSGVNVFLNGIAAQISALYSRELEKNSGPWKVPFMALDGGSPDNSIIILSKQNLLIKEGNLALSKPILYTHASWGELMTFAIGTACNQIYFYHGHNTILSTTLRNIGRKIGIPTTEG